MSLTVTVNQITVAILNDNNCKVDRTIDMANTATFTAVDLTGLQHWQPGQPVSITDSLLGLVFTGYVDNVDETNLYPNPAILSKVSCVGTRYLADKRYYQGQEFSNRLAGDIVTEFLAVMAQDGVQGQYSKDHAASYADWSTGTLTNTAPSMDLNGCLELAPSGSQVNTTYDFTGSPSSLVPGIQSGVQAGNTFTCKSFNAIQYTADCLISGLSNAYLFTKIWAGSHTIVAGDFLKYDVWINNTSPAIQACIDFTCSDGTTFRAANIATWDNQHLTGAPSNNLTGLADNQWYTRSFGLAVGALTGKTITSIALAFGANNTGHYIAYFRRINIVNGGSNVVAVFNDTSTATPQIAQIIGNSGYANMQCNVVTAYDSKAVMFGGFIDLSPAGICNNSLISWTVDLPANCTALATVCVDVAGGSITPAVFMLATNNGAIPGLIAGENLSNQLIQWFFFLYNNGPDPTVTPVFHSLSFQVNPSYQATKSDFRYKVKVDADYAAGTMTNLMESLNVLQLNGYQANLTATIPGSTLFGTASPADYINNRSLALQSDSGTDVRLRMDFAGAAWTNGVMEVDVQVPNNANNQIGVVYRCSNWGTGNNTFAYVAFITSAGINLGRGTNVASSSPGTYTSIQTVALTLNAGDWHRLKVVFNGSTHTVYLDDVQYISTTDATYSAAGNVGLRFSNGSGSAGQIGSFYNFGIAAALSGTWVSPAFSLATVGTVLAAFTRTQGQGDSPQSSLLTEISYDGGSTWQTCAAPPIATTNVGSWIYDSESIPGLPAGTNTASLTNCKIRLTLSVSSAAAHIETNGTLFYVLSAYSATGQRLSRPLSIQGVNRIGSASLSWVGVTPANTNIQVEASKDGVTWVTEGTGASGNVSVSGFNSKPDPLIDSFDTISSSSYLNTNYPGGSPATWYYDTTNSRLQATGGTKALYVNQTFTTNDVTVTCDMDYSDGGGLVLDYATIAGNLQYYYLVVNDSAAITGTPNTVTLYRQGASSISTLASAPITFVHGSPHRFVFQNIGGNLTASIDGTQILSYTDPAPLVSGYVGLWSNGGSAEFYQLYVQGLGDPVLSGAKLSTRITLTSTDPTATPQLQDLAVSIRAGNLHDGAVIPNTSYSVLSNSQNTMAQSMDDLAKQSNTVWWIDDTLNLNFQHKLGQPAPWIATGATMIASSIKVSNVQPGYRNTKWLNNGHDFVNKTQTIKGDGQTTSWDVGYPVQIIQSMTINGYAVSFAPKGQTGAAFYYEVGKTTITADPSTRVLGALDKLVVNYVGQVTISVQMRHHKSRRARATTDKTSGAVELVQDATGLNKQAALQFAAGLLNEYTQTGRQIVFTTLNVGLAPGQLLTCFLPQFNLFDDVLVITDVSIVWQKTNQNGIMIVQPFFTITCVEGAIVGDWTRLFTRLGKA